MSDETNSNEMVNSTGGTLEQEHQRQAEEAKKETDWAAAISETMALQEALNHPLAQSMTALKHRLTEAVFEIGVSGVAVQLSFACNQIKNKKQRDGDMVGFARYDEEEIAWKTIRGAGPGYDTNLWLGPGFVLTYGSLSICEELQEVVRGQPVFDDLREVHSRIITASGFKRAN